MEEKWGKRFELIGKGRNFLNRTTVAQTQRSKSNKWDLMKLENIHNAKDIVNKTNQQPTDWEKYSLTPH